MRQVVVGPGIVVFGTFPSRTPPIVACIDGVQPHRYCEQEGVSASAVPLLRGDWRLRLRPTAEVMTDDGTQAAE